MQLIAARHPMLVAQEAAGDLEHCVPIDLRLGDDFDLVVITGPNTGGKTLALKTAGLAALCCALGLPVICKKGSRVPFYARIFCDIGDEQEVEQSLSTFSSHLARLRRALGEDGAPGAGPDTLVLVDELGGGTDPDEGAALGEALLEELVTRGAPALVSTHLGRLKEVAYRLPRAENASCEFDLETLAPSYRLVIGEPGESRALSIARRLGLPSALIDRAAQLLESVAGSAPERDALFRDLTRARRDIEAIRTETEERLRTVETERAVLDQARVRAEAEQKLLVREAQTSLEERLRDAKSKLAAARSLLPRLSKPQATELGAALEALEETLTGATLDDTRRAFLASLKKGDHVWIPRYRKKCPITRIFKDKQRVRVRFGRQDLEIGFEEISTYDTI
jgi:DNA mismatch repair protein MutS2